MSDNKKPSVLHVSFLAKAGNGIVNQLKAEIQSVKKLNIPWEVVLVTETTFNEPFVVTIPHLYSKNFFLKRLYFHLWLVRKIRNRHYDIILLRYIKSDPFLFIFRKIYKKYFLVHHSKELEEIKLSKSIFSKVLVWFENILGVKSICSSLGIITMTEEIAKYQLNRINKKLPYFVYPNGVDTDYISIAPDNRIGNEINIVFVASSFLPWHGLDLLLNKVSYFNYTNDKIIFHLIGNVPEIYLEQINKINSKKVKIILHGYIDREKMIKVLSICDIGLASLALKRINLEEACVLKVREYLASGLPVYSASRDAGLSKEFPYFIVDEIDLDKIINFAFKMKSISRLDVRKESIKYIEKFRLVNKLYEFLVEEFNIKSNQK